MIKVLDSVMGTGKTTGIFNMMRNNPDKRYLYISLFLDEVGDGNKNLEGRVQKELPEMEFKMPKNFGEGKLEALKKLISNRENIASTHALFSIFDNEVVEMLVQGEYVLVVDEAVDCVGMYDGVNDSDIQAMLSSEMITLLDNNQLVWNEVRYPNHSGKYHEVREYCNLGSLFLHKQKILIWEYPPKLLQLLPEVYIMSYLFEGSVMSCWLKINNLQYEYLDNVGFGLKSEEDVKKVVRECLQLVDSSKLKALKQKETAFSSSWYKDNLDKEMAKWVKSILESCVVNHKPKGEKVFWTCFKDYQHKVNGKGFSKAAKGELEPFLPCNTKATNNYRDYSLCMYTINVYKNPMEVGYLRERGVEFDKDKYALSEMIQFVWRGCIRQGKPMKLLVLSNRMKKLLEGWLNDE